MAEKKYSCKNYVAFQEKVPMVLCTTCKKYTECYDWANQLYRMYQQR